MLQLVQLPSKTKCIDYSPCYTNIRQKTQATQQMGENAIFYSEYIISEMIYLFDNYLLMHLTTFFHVSDFSRLVKTSKLFREQIVLELLQNRMEQ